MFKTITFTLFAAMAVGFLIIPSEEVYKFEGENHFTNIRMLTQESENAEAYLSFDEKQLIFQSSTGDTKCDQIFAMNIDGTGLKQITFNETFDGFPMFTSDGKQLIFASNRFNNKKGDTNIFIADWFN